VYSTENFDRSRMYLHFPILYSYTSQTLTENFTPCTPYELAYSNALKPCVPRVPPSRTAHSRVPQGRPTENINILHFVLSLFDFIHNSFDFIYNSVSLCLIL